MRMRRNQSRNGATRDPNNPKTNSAKKQDEAHAIKTVSSKADVLSSQPSESATRIGSKPVRNISRRRRWFYRLIAMTVVPVFLLALLEFGLRIFGYGYPTTFFVERPESNNDGPIYAENLNFGRRFFPPGLVRHPMTIAMPKVKKEGTYRVFVLGESAAMGFPDSTASFARILEVMLREAYPDTRFEIINTSVTAINSHVVRTIAQECAQHQPDLFIVHLGNNEVVGPYGVAGVLGSYSPSLSAVRASMWVKRTRVGQLLGSIIREIGPNGGAKSWDGMAMFQKSHVSADDQRLDNVLSNFRSNLGDICEVGKDAGAHMIVCTIPVNLRNCAPFASKHRRELSAEKTAEWLLAYNHGVSLEEAGKYADAVTQFETAASIDDRYADLQFRMARCSLALGQNEDAKQRFKLARDLDALRFRSDTRINQAIREVARGNSPRVYLVDAESDFEAISKDGVPGDDLFLEHVHMNFHGNYSLAKSTFRAITNILPLHGVVGEPEPLSENECADRLGYTNWSRFKTESTIRSMMYDPPFSNQLDHLERSKRLEARLADLKATLQPAVLEAIAKTYEQALLRSPNDWMIRANFASFLSECGDPERALVHYQLVTRQVPHHYEALRLQGSAFQAVGQSKEAVASLEAAIRIHSDYSFAYFDLAYVLATHGKVDEATEILARRVEQEPDRVDALANFARFLMQYGRRTEARQKLNEALAISPDAPGANMVMGHLLVREGATEKAIIHFETALRSRPRLLPEVTAIVEHLRRGKGQNPK